jgi:hypothetical protein
MLGKFLMTAVAACGLDDIPREQAIGLPITGPEIVGRIINGDESANLEAHAVCQVAVKRYGDRVGNSGDVRVEGVGIRAVAMIHQVAFRGVLCNGLDGAIVNPVDVVLPRADIPVRSGHQLCNGETDAAGRQIPDCIALVIGQAEIDERGAGDRYAGDLGVDRCGIVNIDAGGCARHAGIAMTASAATTTAGGQAKNQQNTDKHPRNHDPCRTDPTR